MLLVDDRDGEVGEIHFSLDERVRPDGDADVARGDELMGGPPLARRRLEVSRATRTPSCVQSDSIVRKCCSASVSVGAMSAPWRPASTARSSV